MSDGTEPSTPANCSPNNSEVTKRGPYKKRPKQVELPPGLPELATAAQVAVYLHVTEAALAQFRYKGEGPKFVKVGHKVLYRWVDVLEYLQQNTWTATASNSLAVRGAKAKWSRPSSTRTVSEILAHAADYAEHRNSSREA